MSDAICDDYDLANANKLQQQSTVDPFKALEHRPRIMNRSHRSPHTFFRRRTVPISVPIHFGARNNNSVDRLRKQMSFVQDFAYISVNKIPQKLCTDFVKYGRA